MPGSRRPRLRVGCETERRSAGRRGAGNTSRDARSNRTVAAAVSFPYADSRRQISIRNACGPDRAGDSASCGCGRIALRQTPSLDPPVRRRPRRQQVRGGSGVRPTRGVRLRSVEAGLRILRLQAGAVVRGPLEGGARFHRPTDILWLIRQQSDELRFRHRPGAGSVPRSWLQESGLDRAMREVARRGLVGTLGGHGDPQGYAPLREDVSRRLAAARGRCDQGADCAHQWHPRWNRPRRLDT